MAEMLIDGAKLDACNTAEADAIRAKTGGSSPIPYDYANNKGFADAIAAIETGGGVTTQPLSVTENGTYTAPSGTAYTPVTVNVPTGGSLPSVISKIDGGSFTLSTTATCRSTPIQHSLAVTPKGFFIWSDDAFNEEESDTTIFLVNGYAVKADVTNASGQQSGTWVGYYRRSSDKRVSINNGVIPTSNVGNFFGASEICLHTNDVKFRQGKTYKWLAWA